ncbi:tripartite tricarboxylate transporter substrate binding protein [Zwartia sp.]|uniref:Bug family tripartite tricarboxylate transporter substrate binding protein n=1 Tax=Zwartia sp. TaxID=2978004 RepID=UPI002719A628|nr:tripartite tricarboxylate transporter substrate binding protein [Zwartia sp.]MDO9023954.1 tripartite tricarboxylate transporter substrate binding protein [Zwartia sp.]
MKLQKLLIGAAAIISALSTSAVIAQDYPSKPIKLIVPFAPGGGADNTARIISDPLSKRLGQPVIIEYKPGAGGVIGAAFVAAAPKDGYTLLYATPGQQMTAPYLMDKMPYDAATAFSSVIELIEGSNVLVVNKDLPVNSVKELIAYAKANPEKVNFASSGIGSSSHLAGELFKSMAGINITHVPYKGSGAAVTEVVGGSVQMSIDSLSVYQAHIKAGNVKALGVSTLGRNPAMPELPPIADTLKGYSASPINYITVPAGTSPAIIAKLNKELNEVLNMPGVRERLIATGLDVKGGTPQHMDEVVRSESAKWKKVIEQSKAASTTK